MKLTIAGQVRGGKNQMQVDPRTGRHYPNAKWAAWRDAVVMIIKAQSRVQFTIPLYAEIRYRPGDARRRDVPALQDALWHCLEKAGIVADDSLIQDVNWKTLNVDRENPGVEIIPSAKGAA